MAPITIGIGSILVLLGVAGYVATEAISWTALIPAFFGAALILLGVLARQDKMRKHAMHAAVLVGLVGLIVPAVRVAGALANGTGSGLAFWMQAATAVVCGVFVALCVKSFIDARRKRGPQATE